VRLCCEGCVKPLEKDPSAAIANIDAAVVAEQQPHYPLESCVVSDEPLGSMGDPIDYVHGTRLVRFCCKGCVKAFKKDPAKVMAEVDKAWIEAQRPSYPLPTCVISDHELAEDTVDFLYGTRLVRFCCADCIAEFEKDPASHLAVIAAAAEAARHPVPKGGGGEGREGEGG
jgi:YHS domain-containing protein